MNPVSLDDAFDYNTTISGSQFKPLCFSSVCIFCNSPFSNTLMADGSYRQCLKCKKTFKAQIKKEIKGTVAEIKGAVAGKKAAT